MKSIIAKENTIIMQFVPIFLILFYSIYRYKFSKISHSILGKLFAIMLILYYTRIDFLYGTACCILVIIYYQFSEFEGFAMLSEDRVELDKSKKITATATETIPIQPQSLDEINNSVKAEPELINIEQFHAAKDEFIKEKCKNGVLMYKDFPVRSEMADHVYSEIKFNTKQKCNPCDRTCDYNIIEAKLKTERELLPKTSNDIFDAIGASSLRDIFKPKREKYQDVKPASGALKI